MSAEFDDGKDESALRTIGEVSKALDIKTHVLRYWEQQFPMLEPLKRSGGRRYYRPADVQLVERIDRLVNDQGYTLKGAKQVIEQGEETPQESASVAEPPAEAEPVEPSEETAGSAAEVSHENQPVIGNAPIADDGGLASFFGEEEQPQGTDSDELNEPEVPQMAGDPAGLDENASSSMLARAIDRDVVVERLKSIHRSLSDAIGA